MGQLMYSPKINGEDKYNGGDQWGGEGRLITGILLTDSMGRINTRGGRLGGEGQ